MRKSLPLSPDLCVLVLMLSSRPLCVGADAVFLTSVLVLMLCAPDLSVSVLMLCVPDLCVGTDALQARKSET